MTTWKTEPWAKSVPSELALSLDNLEHDDKKAPTLPEAVEEARYILGLFSEGGTASSDMLESDDKSVRAEARKIIRDLNRFIKTHGSKP